MSNFPELPPATGPNLPPFDVFPSEIPARYPWPEIIDAPIPVFARQAPPTAKIGEALIQSEVLPTIPFVSPSNVMRY